MSRLRVLAQWRQNVAIERDLALSYIVKSEHLWKVAKNNPRNTSEMLEMGLTENEVRVRGKRFYNYLLKQDVFRLMTILNLLNVFLKILVIKKQFNYYKKK